jgi:phosphatidyl-myo-inositol dimannoside synthase
MEAPTVAAITLNPTGGGIAVVSDLLWRVFRQHWGPGARLLTMFAHESRPATFIEKAKFSLTLSRAEALGQTDWILFSHLALAQIQHAMPSRFRCRYGIFLHGIEAWKPLSASEQRVLAAADLRVSNSRYTASRVMDRHPNIGQVDACPLAVPPAEDTGRPTSAEPVPSLGRHAVLVVGRMLGSERYKGHDQLIDAWPQVVARVPDAQLVIVGDGDDCVRLKRKAAESSAGGCIAFTGFVAKATLEALYERAALFALPSRGEGFGLVYLEAMAHGLACIGSIHDAAPEVIVDGVTGALVDQDDISSLAETLATLLLDQPRRQALGEAGRARLLGEFSFDRFSRRLCSLIEARHAGPANAAL